MAKPRRFCSGHVVEIWTTPQKHRKKSLFCEFSHRFNRLSSLSSLSDSAVLQSQGAGVTERMARNTGTHGVFKPPRSLMDAVFCSVGQDSRSPSGRRGGARGHGYVKRHSVATPVVVAPPPRPQAVKRAHPLPLRWQPESRVFGRFRTGPIKDSGLRVGARSGDWAFPRQNLFPPPCEIAILGVWIPASKRE